MPLYSISVSVNIEAEDDNEAHRAAHDIMENLNSIGDEATIIDIEEIDE
jgi:HPt (histidine-containing phosphotransfer) domain-containing protein